MSDHAAVPSAAPAEEQKQPDVPAQQPAANAPSPAPAAADQQQPPSAAPAPAAPAAADGASPPAAPGAAAATSPSAAAFHDDGAPLEMGPSIDPSRFASQGNFGSPQQQEQQQHQHQQQQQNPQAPTSEAGGSSTSPSQPGAPQQQRRPGAPKKINPAEEPPVPARPVPIQEKDIPPRLRGLYGKAELLFYAVVVRRTASGLFNKNKPGLVFLTPSALFILDMSFMVTRYVPVGELASPCGVFEQTKQVLLKPVNDVEILISFPDPQSPDLDDNAASMARACGGRGLAQFVRCLYAAHFFAHRPPDVPAACNPPLRLTKMAPDVMLKSLSRSARSSPQSSDRQSKIEMRLKGEMNSKSGITRPLAAQAVAEAEKAQHSPEGAERDQEGAGATGSFQPDMRLHALAEQYAQKAPGGDAAQAEGHQQQGGGHDEADQQQQQQGGDAAVPPVVALAQKYAQAPNAEQQGGAPQPAGMPSDQQQQQQMPGGVGAADRSIPQDHQQQQQQQQPMQGYGAPPGVGGMPPQQQQQQYGAPGQQQQQGSMMMSMDPNQTPQPQAQQYQQQYNQQQQQNSGVAPMNSQNFASGAFAPTPSTGQFGAGTGADAHLSGVQGSPGGTALQNLPVGTNFAKAGSLPRVRAPGNRESLAMMALCYASFVRVADFALPEHLARTPSGAPHPIMPYLMQSVLLTLNPTGNAIFWRPMTETPLWSFNALHDVEAIHFRRGGLVSILVRPYGGRSQPSKMTIQPMLYRPNIGAPEDPDELKTIEADVTIPAEREELIRSAKSLLEVLHALAPHVQFTVDRPDSSSRTSSHAPTSARDSQVAGHPPAASGQQQQEQTPDSARSSATHSSQRTGSQAANAMGPTYNQGGAGGSHDGSSQYTGSQQQQSRGHSEAESGSHRQGSETPRSGYSGTEGSTPRDGHHQQQPVAAGAGHPPHATRDMGGAASEQSGSRSGSSQTPRGYGAPPPPAVGQHPPPHHGGDHHHQYAKYDDDAHRQALIDADRDVSEGRTESSRGGHYPHHHGRGGGGRGHGGYDDDYYDDRYSDDRYYDDRDRHHRRGGGGGGGRRGDDRGRDDYYNRRGGDRRHPDDRYYDDRRDRHGRGYSHDSYDDRSYTPSDYTQSSRGGSRSRQMPAERGGGGGNVTAVSAVLKGVPVKDQHTVEPIEKSADVPVDAVKIMSEVDWRSIIQQDPVTAATVMADAQQQWEMERAAIAHELLRMHEERSLLLTQNDALQHQVSEVVDGRGAVAGDVQKLSQQCFQLQQQLQAERKIRQQCIDDNVYKTERFFEGVIISQQDEADLLKDRLRRLESVLERVGDAAGSSPKYVGGAGASSPGSGGGARALDSRPAGMHLGSEGPFSPNAIGYHPSTVTNRASSSPSSAPQIQYTPGTTSGPLAAPAAGASPSSAGSGPQASRGLPVASGASPSAAGNYYGGPSPPRAPGAPQVHSPYASPSSRTHLSTSSDPQSLRYSLMMDT